jgi:hypothetical protein
MGIEYLLFEELVLSTGAKLSRKDYERCLKDRMKFSKMIRQLSPDHEKAQKFTSIVANIESGKRSVPNIIFWRPRELESAWGKLSKYLHWTGAHTETTKEPKWVDDAYSDAERVLMPIWEDMCSGHSGLLHPDNMTRATRVIWEDFRTGKIDSNSARIRLEIIRPLRA